MNERDFDVVMIGAGLAGLWCAREIAEAGKSVLLVDRKSDLKKGVHTTGIFVRKTFEDFALPANTLGPDISAVSLYSPGQRSMDLVSEKAEFRVGDMPSIYVELLEQCKQKGVVFLGETRFIGCETSPTGVNVSLEKNRERFSVKAKLIIGADGARSRVSEALGLDKNKETIVGYERVYQRTTVSDEARLHCFVDAKLAPGYLAWVSDDGRELHIGVGGYAERFEPKTSLEIFEKTVVRAKGLIPDVELKETRGGIIPVGGVLRNIANRHGLLIGDAAGAVSPLTAGGLDPCLRLSRLAAQIVIRRLDENDPQLLLEYSGDLFRSRFISRLWMRRLISLLRFNSVINAGFILADNPIGRRLARHIFFGRGSFPDIQFSKTAKHEATTAII